MPKKKPKEGPPSLGDLKTKDLLKAIRDDLSEQAKKAEPPESPLARLASPPKPHRSK